MGQIKKAEKMGIVPDGSAAKAEDGERLHDGLGEDGDFNIERF